METPTKVVAVRGAIKVAGNDKASIHSAAVKLANEILVRNQIGVAEVISVICSLTEDLTAANPATGLRFDRFGEVPLFCVQEARVDGQMDGVIRLLLTFHSPRADRPRPVYLDGAEGLRPDLEKA
jgi:chorismate mutase